MASISQINQELYEAAKIDGANWFKQTLYITIPSLKNIGMYLCAKGQAINIKNSRRD